MSNLTAQNPPTDQLFDLRVDYAHKCFANMQELIRFMDQKAGFILAAVGILAAALGTFAANVFDGTVTNSLNATLRLLGGGFLTAYLIVGFVVVLIATSVFAASPNRLRPDTTAPGLIFPLILLKKFSSNEELYLQTLVQMTPATILHDYANQIMEIANIYQVKQKRVNQSLALFRWSGILWLITMLTFLGTMLIR